MSESLDLARGLGFKEDRLAAAAAVLDDECERGSFPGAACLVARSGEAVLRHACGRLSTSRDIAVTNDTVFDMASVTKPLTTAIVALRLAEAGKLSFWQSVTEFFPERELPHLAGVTLKHLITHTSGLPAWVDLYSGTETREQAVERLFAIPLKNPTGEVYEYSCMGFIMLGLICEKVAGESLQSYLKREIWGPLGMKDTGFLPDAISRDRIASTDHCPARDHELVGVVHDGNAWRMGGISGNAGLFSSTADLLIASRSIMGLPGAPEILSRLTRKRYCTTQIEPRVGYQSYGWFCYGSDMLPAGDFLPEGTFGHTGFTGTSMVFVPSEEIVIILLTNRVCLDHDGSQIRRTRRRFHNLIASAII